MATILEESIPSLTGVQSNFALGNVTAIAKAGVTLTGLEETFATGTFSIDAPANVYPTGVQAMWHVNPEQYPLWAWTKETGGATTETWTRELGKAA